LASQSAGRRAILANAGIVHDAMTSPCDEEAEKAHLRAQGVDPRGLALGLAEAKALATSPLCPGGIVLGCDQTLALEDGMMFDKARTLAEQADHLRHLSGKTHSLYAAIVAVRDGERLWRHVGEARMTMRPLSDAFIEDYLAHEGEDLLSGVGGYRVEGRGIQLFERIEGSQFNIIGLPLLPLLAFLREAGVISA
jgi:septum formation protein